MLIGLLCDVPYLRFGLKYDFVWRILRKKVISNLWIWCRGSRWADVGHQGPFWVVWKAGDEDTYRHSFPSVFAAEFTKFEVINKDSCRKWWELLSRCRTISRWLIVMTVCTIIECGGESTWWRVQDPHNSIVLHVPPFLRILFLRLLLHFESFPSDAFVSFVIVAV